MTSVTVISPSFNQKEFLTECLESVAAQQAVDFEHLIFDPGSTDGSRDVAEAHAARHSFVKYFPEPDSGQVEAINKGLERATGDILTWLNSDDSYIGTDVLERVVAEFDAHPEIDVICGRGTYITPTGDLIKEAWVHRDGEAIPDRLRNSIGLVQPSVFFRRSVYEKVGGLDPTFNLSLDYDYWIRFAKAGVRFHFLDQLLVKMTLHKDSKTIGSRGPQFHEYLNLLRSHYGRPDPVWVDRTAMHRTTGRDGMIDTSRTLTRGQAARYRYHHADLRRQFFDETPPVNQAVVATTFDAAYFDQGLNLIAGLHRTSLAVVKRIVIYDLGLTNLQREHLDGYDRVTVVDYPDEARSAFDGYLSPKNYAYKCAAIHAAAEFAQDGEVVVFMDAGIVPLRSIREIVERASTEGIFLVDHGDISTWPIYNIQFTAEDSLAAMGATGAEAMGKHVCSCLVAYTKAGPFQRLVDEAYEYSKDPNVVVAPKHLADGERIEAEVGQEANVRRASILTDLDRLAGVPRDELRSLFGYFGHRQDQSIYSLLAARHGASQQPAIRYNSSNPESSRASKLNWESGSVSDDIAVSRMNLEATDSSTVIYHHRGTFSNLDGAQHDDRTSDCIFLLGNGPSLASVDLRQLEGVDTLGMNAAYRHWQDIGWYPSYYVCLDTVVGVSHADAIADMVHNCEENGIRRFFLRENILEVQPALADHPRVQFFERETKRRSGLGARPLTTGSHSLVWAWLMGYTRVFLLGVDLDYVEIIDEAVLQDDGALSITSEVSENPNYFFAGYQQEGDRYNVPNPDSGLHQASWEAAREALPDVVDVFNLNPSSALKVFDFMGFDDAVKEAQVTQRSIVRAFDPPARPLGSSGYLIGPFERKQATFSESDAIHAYIASMRSSPGVMVDVGAHFGGSLGPFADDDWTIYGFEPDDDNLAALRQRMDRKWDLRIETRAVSFADNMMLPFYQSTESTGVSGLSAFLDTHREVQRVTTVTLNTFMADKNIAHVDFLKVDTEGHDLNVLEGYPWHLDKPDVVLCEFENRKTEPLGYQTEDMAGFLHEMGYEVLLSEWHPVVRYGVPHDFRALRQWEPGAAHPKAWGNLIGVRGIDAARNLVAVSEPLVEMRVSATPEKAIANERLVATVAPTRTIRTMARRLLERRRAVTRRLLRWYASPSGVLFFAALIAGGFAIAGAPGAKWFGLGALAALALFVPYKFSREQVRSDRRLSDRAKGLDASISHVKAEAAKRDQSTRMEVKRAEDASAELGVELENISRDTTRRFRESEVASAAARQLGAAAQELLERRLAEADALVQELRSTVDRLGTEASRLHDELDLQAAALVDERNQRISDFGDAVDVLSTSLFLTGEREDGSYIVNKGASSDLMKDRKLIFVASSGRAGSHYLAQLLGTAENVYATHEAPPYMIGHHLRAVLDRPLSVTYDRRRIKGTAIRATLSSIPRNIVYAEANHMFIKTFHDVVMNEFDPSGLSVILLRRRLDRVLKSILDLGYFTKDNNDWKHWMHLPHGAHLFATPPIAIEDMDEVDRAIGYLFDIEARMQRFATDYPGVNVVPTTISQISTPQGAEDVLRQVRLAPTERTDAVVGQPTNARVAARLREVDLDECRSRILAYHHRALEAGVFAPDLTQLLED